MGVQFCCFAVLKAGNLGIALSKTVPVCRGCITPHPVPLHTSLIKKQKGEEGREEREGKEGRKGRKEGKRGKKGEGERGRREGRKSGRRNDI